MSNQRMHITWMFYTHTYTILWISVVASLAIDGGAEIAIMEMST